MKVILTSNKEILNTKDIFSIECGKHDGKFHFDHHGEFESNDCVAISTLGHKIPKNSTIIISHLDADSLIAINNLMGNRRIGYAKMLEDIAQADIHGSHTIEKADAYFYNTGLKALIRDIRVPRVSDELFDITDIVMELINTDVASLIAKGQEEYKNVDKILQDGIIDKVNKTIFLKLNQLADITILYSKDIKNIVVFRENWKTISLYSSDNAIVGTYAGIDFKGHPMACGSPRGEIMNIDIAKKVFEEISKM